MFYRAIKNAWLAGRITVEQAERKPDDVLIVANGLLGLAARFLTETERRLLSELARFSPAFIVGLPEGSDDWSREQRQVVAKAIHGEGIPRFPASVAKLEAELPQRRYLS